MFQALAFECSESPEFMEQLLNGKRELIVKIQQNAAGWDYQLKATVELEDSVF